MIEAKNRYYHMNICPAYWQWIVQKNQSHEVASITMVEDELLAGDDELTVWVRAHKHLFISVSDQATQHAFITLVTQMNTEAARMKPGALDEFLSGADPWLIAKAMTTGATLVTHESLNPEVKRKFLIPNLCKHFNVPYINTFDMLHTLGAQFVLQG